MDVRTTALHYRAAGIAAKTKGTDITRPCQDPRLSMTRKQQESLDFNMSMPDWERSVDGRRSKHYLEGGSDIRVKRKRRVFAWCVVVVEANRKLRIPTMARVLVKTD